MQRNKEQKDVTTDSDWFEESEGQLALDVYQTEESVVVKAPIAGVKAEDLEVTVTDEVVTVKGGRHDDGAVQRESYFVQECFWGAFSRSYVLPVAVDADRAEAILKDGLLTIVIPKLEKSKTRVVQIQSLSQ